MFRLVLIARLIVGCCCRLPPRPSAIETHKLAVAVIHQLCQPSRHHSRHATMSALAPIAPIKTTTVVSVNSQPIGFRNRPTDGSILPPGIICRRTFPSLIAGDAVHLLRWSHHSARPVVFDEGCRSLRTRAWPGATTATDAFCGQGTASVVMTSRRRNETAPRRGCRPGPLR
jgi:hypothetical protein